jgi:hypothetical protein
MKEYFGIRDFMALAAREWLDMKNWQKKQFEHLDRRQERLQERLK